MANTSVSGGGAGTAANGNVAGGAATGGNGNFVKKPPIGSASWSFTDNEPDTKYDHAWSIANFARKVSYLSVKPVHIFGETERWILNCFF